MNRERTEKRGVRHSELGIRSVNLNLRHKDDETLDLPMNVTPIQTEKDYRDALKRIDDLIALDPKEDTQDFAKLDLISTLVETYENSHYSIN